ncbi:hypothetical protein Nepgr_017676 [Nepenthes gracilis]|uniref:Uncharacterized protein n=1 Tax=Nepenthes gracilis TaxID=150966 RepID=A0AAD3SRW0_NEPGR|nr:hypothetical protein Nepgr_017676 [Nepenthes gracilis]
MEPVARRPKGDGEARHIRASLACSESEVGAEVGPRDGPWILASARSSMTGVPQHLDFLLHQGSVQSPFTRLGTAREPCSPGFVSRACRGWRLRREARSPIGSPLAGGLPLPRELPGASSGRPPSPSSARRLSASFSLPVPPGAAGPPRGRVGLARLMSGLDAFLSWRLEPLEGQPARRFGVRAHTARRISFVCLTRASVAGARPGWLFAWFPGNSIPTVVSTAEHRPRARVYHAWLFTAGKVTLGFLAAFPREPGADQGPRPKVVVTD